MTHLFDQKLHHILKNSKIDPVPYSCFSIFTVTVVILQNNLCK